MREEWVVGSESRNKEISEEFVGLVRLVGDVVWIRVLVVWFLFSVIVLVFRKSLVSYNRYLVSSG